MLEIPNSAHTQLMVALYSNQFAYAQMMIASGQVTSIPYMAFMLMIQKGAPSILILQDSMNFAEVQGYIAYNNYESLRWAATHGEVGTMELLLGRPGVRENVGAIFHELMKIAIERGNLPMVAFLSQLPEVRAHIIANNNILYRYAVILARDNTHPGSTPIMNHLWQIDAVRNFVVLPPPVPMVPAFVEQMAEHTGKRSLDLENEPVKERKLNPELLAEGMRP